MDFPFSNKIYDENKYNSYKMLSPFLKNSKITQPRATFFSSIFNKGKLDSMNTDRVKGTDGFYGNQQKSPNLAKTTNFFNSRSNSTNLVAENAEKDQPKNFRDCVIDKRCYKNVNKPSESPTRRKRPEFDHRNEHSHHSNNSYQEKSQEKYEKNNRKKFANKRTWGHSSMTHRSLKPNDEDFFTKNEPLKIDFSNTKNTFGDSYLFTENSNYDKFTSKVNFNRMNKAKSNAVLDRIYKKLGKQTRSTSRSTFYAEDQPPCHPTPYKDSFKQLSKNEVLEKMFQNKFKQQLSSQVKAINKLTNKESIKFRPKELARDPSQLIDSYEMTLSTFPVNKINCQSDAYQIYDVNHSEVLWSKNAKIKKEIACLTKIMTFYTAIQMASELNIDVNRTPMVVSQNAAMYNLKGGRPPTGKGKDSLMTDDVVDMIDLLYGMMLTTGNDCAKTIAENVGSLLEDKKMEDRRKSKKENNQSKNLASCDQIFIKYMNNYAQELGMDNTVFSNCHGIVNSRNFSTCEDMIKLVEKAMAIHSFRQIIKTVRYSVTIKRKNEPLILTWENLNKQIIKNVRGCIGIKSGINKNTPESQASWWNTVDKHFIIIQLGCNESDEHYKEADVLFNWAYNNLKHIRNAPQSLRNK